MMTMVAMNIIQNILHISAGLWIVTAAHRRKQKNQRNNTAMNHILQTGGVLNDDVTDRAN
jgi:hypothetical protein